MAKRSEIISKESLTGLFAMHPYLLVFKKFDWDEYLSLLAYIYDLLEEENTRVPLYALESQLHKCAFFSPTEFFLNKV